MPLQQPRLMGCVYRSITSRDGDMVISLYSALARLHLEHWVQFWALLFKKDAGRLERAKGEPALRGKTKRSYFSSPSGRDITSPSRREGSGAPYHSIPPLKGWIKRGWRLSLHKETHGEGKGQQLPVALGEVSSQGKKGIFQSDNS